MNAVDSEHEKNLMNDAWRLFQLEKATGNPNHPFSKFGTGLSEYNYAVEFCIKYMVLLFIYKVATDRL